MVVMHVRRSSTAKRASSETYGKHAHSATSACQLRRNPAQLIEVLARLLQLGHGAALSAQEESSDLLAVGDAANAKLRMLEDRNGVVVQVRSPQGRRPST